MGTLERRLKSFIFSTIGILLLPSAIFSQAPKQQPAKPAATTPDTTSSPPAQPKQQTRRKPSVDSIYVGQPKIYDDRSLESMLGAAEQRLATLQFLDQASVAAKVGTLQGGTSQQSQLNIQAQGAPIPQVLTKQNVSTAPAAPVTTETDTTRPGLSPTVPSLSTSGTPSLPATFSPSSLDTLNEEMQLTYDVTNLRLLLEGSLNDRFISPLKCPDKTEAQCTDQGYMSKLPAWVSLKQRATIGFPISIQPPEGSKYNYSVAEVVVRVTTGQNCAAMEPPGVMTILPRERTYNEATITDRSLGFGLAAVTQVFSVGVAGSKRSQTYFIVQDLDTVAFQDTPTDQDGGISACETSFGWQFRPTLGRKKVRGGLRQTFVQLSFAVDSPDRTKELGWVTVEKRWRHYDPKTGSVGAIIEPKNDKENQPADWKPIPSFNLKPDVPNLRWTDAGNGQIYVEAGGNYVPGTSVVSGPSSWQEGVAGFTLDSEAIHLVAPAEVFMANEDATIVAPGGYRSHFSRYVAEDETRKPLRIYNVTAKPWSSTDSEVSFCYDGGLTQKGSMDHVLALAGGIVFGLSDRPLDDAPDSNCVSQGYLSGRFRVPTDALQKSKTVVLKQLLLGPDFSAIGPVTFANAFTATKLVTMAKTDDCMLLAIQGTEFGYVESPGNLKRTVSVKIGDYPIVSARTASSCDFAKVTATPPKPTPTPTDVHKPTKTNGQPTSPPSRQPIKCALEKAYVDSTLGPTTLLVAVPTCLLTGAQAIELYRLDDPKKPDEIESVLLPLTPDKPAEVTIDKLEAPQGAKSLKLSGKQLQLIDLSTFRFTNFEDKLITATIAPDESSIQITLPDAVNAKPGYYALNFTLNDKDKTPSAALVRILKPPTPK